MIPARTVRLLFVLASLSFTGCAGPGKRPPDERPAPGSLEEAEAQEHATLERGLSLYSD